MSIARFLCLLLELVCFSVASQLENLKRAYNVTELDPKQLNFPYGSLQVFGSFDSVSFPRYEGQWNFTQQITSEVDSRSIIYHSDETFIKLIDGSNDADVQKIVPFGSDSFILSGSGSLLDNDLGRQLLYNLSDLSLRPIFDDSLSGIESILVDDQLVYFGGNFAYSQDSTPGHSVAIWNHTSNRTFQAPFGGFGENSQVKSIVRLDRDKILFTGRFTSLDNETWLDYTYGNDSRLDNRSSTEIGSAVPLRWADWDVESNALFDASQFSCPNPDSLSWSVSSSTGSLGCSLPFEVTPQKIRIYNSPSDDSGVSLFRIVTRPSGGIMNLTYVDPQSGELRHCDAFCPLLKRSALEDASGMANTTRVILTNNNLTSVQWSESFQDFAFVNEISISQLQILALSSYGNSVGLSSFQLYRGTVPVYANNTLNEFGCNSDAAKSSSVLSSNNWYNGSPQESYLMTQFDYGDSDIPRVTFYPELNHAGQYTVNFYTPGCLADDTCSSRGIVNVTVQSGDDGSVLASTLLYQSNQEQKYDQLYMGYLRSAPIVTLEYHSGLYSNSPSTIVVADRIELIPHAIDVLQNQTEHDTRLNGMFLYQLPNIAEESIMESSLLSNSTLNSFAVENFPQNSSLISIMYNNTLWVGGSVSGVAFLELDSDFSITSSNRFNTGGEVEGMSLYSGGILMFGNFNVSSQPLNTITYNGSFSSLGNLNTSVQTFSNISLNGNELLVFNNEFVLNTTSNEYISNTSTFGLSLWSAGQNMFNDTLFSGAVSEWQYSGLGGSLEIFNNGSVASAASANLTGDVRPYMALKLNNTATVYAYRTFSTSQLVFDNGSHEPWVWPGTVSLMRYMNNGTALAIVSRNPSGETQLNLLNLTTFEVKTNYTMPIGSTVSSALFFGRNGSLLIGGNYSLSDSQCVDLCLYDYDHNVWSNFANGTIKGNISDLQLSDAHDLLISGAMNFDNWTSVNLASLNMTNYEPRPLLRGLDEPLKSFIDYNAGILVWNDTDLLNYRASRWESLQLRQYSEYEIDSVILLNTSQVLEKREDTTFNPDSILVAGRLKNAAVGNLSAASVHDFQGWSPYYFAGASDNGNSSSMVFFTGEDLSRNYDSHSYLPVSVSATTSSPSASQTFASATSASVTSDKKHKIDRGFVVLIGLALALGTVTVLGITGVLLALVFKFDNGYEQVIPRTDEAEMMESVPPEKLLEFL